MPIRSTVQLELKNSDGSITVHFGGDPKQANFVPITEGWNYIVRLYRARNEIINGFMEISKSCKS